MRNLKRALSLAVASVMLMSMMVVGAGAVSFKDADSIENITAATVLEALEIMIGDDAGNFNADKVVSRAEMAAILCRVVYGADVDASNAMGVAAFTDIDGHWAEDYICMAASEGWINGRGDGSFDPDATVATYEAALMLQRSLGYYAINDASDDNYSGEELSMAAIRLANKLGMFDGITAASQAGLTRDEVAVAVYNTLFECVQVAYSTFSEIYYSVEYGNLMNANTDVDFGDPGTYAYDVHDVTIGSDVDVMGRPVDTVLVDEEKVATSPVDCDAIFTSATKMKDLNKKGLVAIDGTDGDDVYLSFNGVSYDDEDAFCQAIFGEDFDADSSDKTIGGIVVEIFDDVKRPTDSTKEEYSYYVAYSYFVDEIDEIEYSEDDEITTIDMADEGEIIIDGDVTDMFAEKDMVVFTYGYNDDGDATIDTIKLATSVEGEVTGYSAGNYYYIDGTKYTLVDTDARNDDGFANGDTIIVYLDPNGLIVATEEVDTIAANQDFLYVYYAEVSMGDLKAKAVLADGTDSIITISKVDGEDADSISDVNYVAGAVNANNVFGFDYDEDKDVYELFTMAELDVDFDVVVSSADAKIKNGYAKAVEASALNARFDDDTIFVDVEEGDVYVGYENVASFDTIDAGNLIAVKDGATAMVVFIRDGAIDGQDGTYVYMLDNSKYVVKDYNVYETAYVDGVKTENLYVDDAERNLLDDGTIYNVTMNDDGYVTEVAIADIEAEGAVASVGGSTIYFADGATYGEADGRYTYDDDSVFVFVNITDEKVSMGDVGDIIKDGDKDSKFTSMTVVANDDDYIEMAYIFYWEI